MNKSDNAIINLVPHLVKKLSTYRGCSFRIAAAAFTKKGNLLGVGMNGHRFCPPTRKGAGKHAEASLIKRYGRRIDTIYVLRTGNAGDILPIHPCTACSSMAGKLGIKIVPIHELLNLC